MDVLQKLFDINNPEVFWAAVSGTVAFLVAIGSFIKWLIPRLKTKWSKKGRDAENQKPKAPPKKPLPAPYTNLPSLPPIFVGRKKDIEDLKRQLSKWRLVSILGAPGIGKTTLANKIAWSCLNRKVFNYIYFVNLQEAKNSYHLFECIRNVLGIERFEINLDGVPKERIEVVEFEQKKDQLITRLNSFKSKVLLLLDSFETVANDDRSAFLLNSILEETRNIYLLITSRRDIGLRVYEKVYDLSPLSIEEAKELFIKHSKERSSIEGGTEIVEEICKLLEYLPFSIELIAQHTRRMSLKEIRDELIRSRLSLQGQKGLSFKGKAIRFKDMLSSLEFTYSQLNGEEKKLFLILSVFRGDFDRKAIKLVSKMNNWDKVLDALIDWHIITRKEEKGISRYALLETLKEYGRLKLANKSVKLYYQHAQYYLKIVQEAAKDLDNYWKEIEREFVNIQQGADWAVDQILRKNFGRNVMEDARKEELLNILLEKEKISLPMWGKLTNPIFRDIIVHPFILYSPIIFLKNRLRWLSQYNLSLELAYNYGFALYKYIFLRGFVPEGLTWLKACAFACKVMEKRHDQAIIYNEIGIQYYSQGRYQEALDWYNRSLEISESISCKESLATTYNNIGEIYRVQGRYQEALDWYIKSLKIKEAIDDKLGLAIVYNNIGLLYTHQGNYKGALIQYEKSLEISKTIGNMSGLARAYNNIGNIYHIQGKYEDALHLCNMVLEISQKISDQLGLAAAYNNIGRIYRDQNRYQEALDCCMKSLVIRERIGDEVGLSTTYHSIGLIHCNRNNNKEALDWFKKSLRILRKLENRYKLASLVRDMGLSYKSLNERKEAKIYLEESYKLYTQLNLMDDANKVKQVLNLL